MRLASNHLLLKKPLEGILSSDKKHLYEALRKGHLFFALDILGNADGFMFQATTTEGLQYIMGDQVSLKNPITLEAWIGPYFQPENYRIKLIHNGSVIKESIDTPLSYEPTEPGAYRVEVEIPWLSPLFITHSYTWIYSNPIYILRD